LIPATLTRLVLGTMPRAKMPRRMLSEIIGRFPSASREAWGTLFSGQKVVVDLAEYLGQDIYMTGAFEREACEKVRSSLRPGDTFLDVGSHLGLYTLIAGGAVGAGGRVHAFEPGDKRRRLLKMNVEANSYAHVTVNDCAVGSHAGVGSFIEGPSRNMGTSHVVEGAGGGPTVKLVSLDEYCAQNGITQVAGMKVDVEGAELGVFQGATHVLGSLGVRFILYETDMAMSVRFKTTPQQVHELLHTAGFTINAFVDGRLVPLKDAPATATDFFATRP
jgi:FkbM family methyltransferase